LLALPADETHTLRKIIYAAFGLRWRTRLNHAETRVASGTVVFADVRPTWKGTARGALGPVYREIGMTGKS